MSNQYLMGNQAKLFRNQINFDPALSGKMHFFVQMINKGSITAAAEESDISISTGSRWITELEQGLGLKLYIRRGNNVVLTHAGDRLFQRFSQISTDIHSLIADLDSISTEPQGLVKVCCTPIFARQHLLPIIGAFNKRYKKIRFTLDINSYGLRQYSKYDLVISAQTSYQPRETAELPLVKRELLSEPFVVVASQDYLTSNPPLDHPCDLLNHTCLYADSLTHTHEWAFQHGEGSIRRYSIPDILEVSDTNLLLEAARMGIGVAYLPRYVTQADIHSKQLIHVLQDYQTSLWKLNVYYPQHGLLDHSCSLFKNFLLGYFNISSASKP